MKKLLGKIVDVRGEELRALWLAFVFNFVILAGYYVLRPIREEIGASSGVENLPWMYTFSLSFCSCASCRQTGNGCLGVRSSSGSASSIFSQPHFSGRS